MRQFIKLLVCPRQMGFPGVTRCHPDRNYCQRGCPVASLLTHKQHPPNTAHAHPICSGPHRNYVQFFDDLLDLLDLFSLLLQTCTAVCFSCLRVSEHLLLSSIPGGKLSETADHCLSYLVPGLTAFCSQLSPSNFHIWKRCNVDCERRGVRSVLNEVP